MGTCVTSQSTHRQTTDMPLPKAQSADKRTTDGEFYFSFAFFSCEPFFSVSHFGVGRQPNTQTTLFMLDYCLSHVEHWDMHTHGHAWPKCKWTTIYCEEHRDSYGLGRDRRRRCVCVAIFDSQITFVRRMCCNSIWLKSKWNCTKMAYRCRCRPEQL